MRRYHNPVMPGFHPDPSVVRVGSDFYMVNSTFHLFPAIQISHSKDLVHWEYIGHGVTREDYLDLSPYEDHWGVWAPDISWRDGLFYIVYPIVNRVGDHLTFENYIIRSERPEGPYSRPILLNREGIDPSHFIDNDGSRYLVFNEGVRIARLNDDSTALTGEPVTLWKGTGRGWPEGPHLFRRGKWYYAMLAEGGTFYGHCVTIARSESLNGPWEECPHNPILIQEDPSHPIQRSGHGKMVDAGNGEWWILYLCGRPTREGKHCVLGRETALDRVCWSADGWPIINEGKGPSVSAVFPDLPVHPLSIPGDDDFTASELGLQWLTIRRFIPGGIILHPDRGRVELKAWPKELDSMEAGNVMFLRERHHHFIFEVGMEYQQSEGDGYSGVACWFDARAYIQFGVSSSSFRLVKKQFGEKIEQSVPFDCPYTGSIRLIVKVEGNRRSFGWRPFEGAVSDVRILFVEEDASFLSDDLDEHSGFTGTLTGMFCFGSDPGASAFFSRVRYTGFDYSQAGV